MTDEETTPVTTYAFARRPRWIALHILVFVVASLFGLAAVWQLHRLDEKRTHNALVRTRQKMAARPIDPFFDSAEQATFRHVTAHGRYDVAREVILRGRGNGDRPGNHILTPLVLNGGRAVIVDRGWVPDRIASPPVVDALPPQDEVVVDGFVYPSEGSGPFSPSYRNEKRLDVVARIDVARLSHVLPYKTFPAYLVLRTQDPKQSGDLPVPARLPPLEEGPHFLYAVQWFLFIAIALIGYATLLRREARKQSAVAKVGIR